MDQEPQKLEMSEWNGGKVPTEIPVDTATWLGMFRAGQVENVYGDYDCPVPGCVCEFSSLADVILHIRNGKHGSIASREDLMNRQKFKYFTRRERVKHEIYREQNLQITKEKVETNTQKTLK